MKRFLATYIRPIIRKFGYDVIYHERRKYYKLPRDFEFDQLTARIIPAVESFTMTTTVRINNVIEAVKYIEKNKIDGAIVECGVWKGGLIMAMALTLNELGNNEREIYLYDTFSGMTAPTDVDVAYSGERAQDTFSKARTSEDSSVWSFSPIKEVKKNVYSTGYPSGKFHFVKGKVEDTIPKVVPEKIALLRLDTDWYESTKHELIHLFPLLSPKGIIIIDDYGFWKGSKKAVDEYISENNLCLFLNRIDSDARCAIKMP